MDLFRFIAEKKKAGIRHVLCTDISRDGMLKGPAFELYKKLKQDFGDLYLIASGGVTTIEDIENLKNSGIDAAVIGKAIYEKRVSLDELSVFL
jgi:phosphoribosylformimino-5-aminoimidazole carboxamide ribotide isomerase